MQARRAARELAFILFSQFDKKITHYSKSDLEDIILKSVRILTSSATDELKIAVGALVAMRDQIDNYEADAEVNLNRPIGVANIPVPIPMTSDMTGRINEMIDIAEKSLANSKLILVKDMEEALELTNAYAPEHLIIETKDYMEVAGQIVNAGSVFLGAFSPESAGDYASGTNHTLPTNGYAKAYSGVSLDSFIRKITFQEILPSGMSAIGPAIEVMAANEHLDAHKNAVTVRLEEIRK